jgi:sugar phosphate permease
VFWLPTIIKSLSGSGIGSTGVLSAVPYALAIVLMLGNSYVSDRVHQRRRLFVWPFLIVGAIAFYLSYRVGTGHFAESFVLLIIAGGVMYAPYGPYFAFIPEFMPQNVSGAAMGAINAFGALGGFAGAYVVGALGGGTKSGAAFIFMAGSLLAAGLLMFLVKRPRVVAPDERARADKARAAAAALAACAGVSPDPLTGRAQVSALHSGHLKTH